MNTTPLEHVDKDNNNDDERLSKFKRTIYFKNCFHKEFSYINNIVVDTFYYCSICRDWNRISEVV